MTRQTGSALKGERMLSVRETAEIMGWCLDSVRRKLRSGEMPGVRLGRSWRVPESQLAAFVGVEHITPPELRDSSVGRRHYKTDYPPSKRREGDKEVVDVLLRTDVVRNEILRLVRQAMTDSRVPKDAARQTLDELGELLSEE